MTCGHSRGHFRHEDRERMNDDSATRRGASMTDREPLQRSEHSGCKPQITAVGSLSGQSLSHPKTQRMIVARRPANGGIPPGQKS
jgi:hypothetical protein